MWWGQGYSKEMGYKFVDRVEVCLYKKRGWGGADSKARGNSRCKCYCVGEHELLGMRAPTHTLLSAFSNYPFITARWAEDIRFLLFQFIF